MWNPSEALLINATASYAFENVRTKKQATGFSQETLGEKMTKQHKKMRPAYATALKWSATKLFIMFAQVSAKKRKYEDGFLPNLERLSKGGASS